MDNGTMELMAFAELSLEAHACSVAILGEDYDEARFRATLVVSKAQKFGRSEVAKLAAAAVQALGPAGTPPGTGYGIHLLAVAKALDVIRPEDVSRDEETDPAA
ncbi:MAG: hypothetical protein AAGC76_13855 [Luteibacter sp.]|uniref:hypothetical protein n=1 Tax=Luteibacter sp. TaxID=1886636 RepID=UPI002808346B|nr:hypothetical protein [Luteibacter sp.]MDQ7996918.1 hypothetical protein [Luteibacter sp.]MDQ8049290.1 hypothetical protein [Luteibacter sp.]